LSNVDFFKNGVPASIIATLVSFSRVGSEDSSHVVSSFTGCCDRRVPSHESYWVSLSSLPTTDGEAYRHHELGFDAADKVLG